jgi:hypothetical protein
LAPLIFNEHNPHPERIKARVGVHDPESFIEYYNRFSNADSRVFADETTISVTAVLDYHANADYPAWCQHRLLLVLRASEEWKIWTGRNNKQFTQIEFLEQNSMDISQPAPASIVEIARDLEAHTEVEFASGTRTTDGQVKLRYTQTIKATVAGGAVDVPERFVLTIPAFVGGERVGMEALLRWRVRDGKLVVWYTLVRPEEVVRNAFLFARGAIAEELKVTIINGGSGCVKTDA